MGTMLIGVCKVKNLKNLQNRPLEMFLVSSSDLWSCSLYNHHKWNTLWQRYFNISSALSIPTLLMMLEIKWRVKDGFSMDGFAAIVPFCTIVLATEESHFFVVKKWNSFECPFLNVVNVAADILCWKVCKNIESISELCSQEVTLNYLNAWSSSNDLWKSCLSVKWMSSATLSSSFANAV